MIQHLQDAVNVGYKKVILRTVDMVVLAVAATVVIDIQELWVAFGIDTLGTSPHRTLLHPLALTSLDLSLYPMHIRDVIGIILWHKRKEVSMGNLESI